MTGAGAIELEREYSVGHGALRRATLLAAVLSWLYALAIPAVFKSGILPARQVDALAPWLALPLEVAALLICTLLLSIRGLLPHRQRACWWLVLLFAALNCVASAFWNLSRPLAIREELSIYDGLYLLDYAILTAAFAVFYVRIGGSFRNSRFWLDAATMVVVQMVVLWSFVMQAPHPRDGTGISNAATLAYTLTLTTMMSMGALLCLEMPRFTGRIGVLFLIAAAAAAATWEVNWLASWLVDNDTIGPYYNFGDVLCFACIVSAASAYQYAPPRPSGGANAEWVTFSFLPALAVLVAIALVSGTQATGRGADAWLTMLLVALCTQLLVVRQYRMRGELRALNQRVAARTADARLAELVRHADDLIVVVDAGGLVSLASPAADILLRTPAAQVQGRPAADLFGAAQQRRLQQFLEPYFTKKAAPGGIELRVEGAGGPLDVKIEAANELDNPLIKGIVLTVHDITGQRALEREVLDAATQERVRLCADLHDGLGQELTGIALMLKAAAARPDPDPSAQRGRLETIVGQINHSIAATRDLARGYSPLHAVRGSLTAALRRLIAESQSGMQIELHVDPAFDDELLGDFVADHLYRICQEAIANASRHSGGRMIEIALRRRGENLAASIADDGRGMRQRPAAAPGLGLKLMEYRAHLIGGTLRILALPAGTCIEVTLPLTLAAASPPRFG